MKSFDLHAPLDKAEVLKLKVGDAATVSGTIFSMRDQAIQRILSGKYDADVPYLKDAVIYNCGPLARKKGNGWDLVSAGPTTSSRMNPLMPRVISEFGISAVIGKGGMDKNVLEAMRGKCVYLSAVGGSGVVSAEQLKAVDVKWLDLGMPEALWTLQAEKFGPLIVTMDAHGGSAYDKVADNVRQKLKSLLRDLTSPVGSFSAVV